MIDLSGDRTRLWFGRIHRWLASRHGSPGIDEALGFHARIRPERVMERLHPDTAARLRAAA